MTALVTVLAVAGALALLLRLARSVGRWALVAAETAATAGLAEISARRGDLTGLAERKVAERTGRMRRRRATGVSVLWFLILAIPLLTPWTREIYAMVAPLWLLPPGPRATRTGITAR